MLQVVGRVTQGELTIVQLKEIPSSDLLVELSAFEDASSASATTAAVSSGAGAFSSAASLPATASPPPTATATVGSSQVGRL